MRTLRQWRKDRKLSQEDLGRLLGFGEQWKTYQAYESGRAPFPKDVRDKLVEMGFEGSFDVVNGAATLGDLQALGNDLARKIDYMHEDLNRQNQALGAALAALLVELQAMKDSRKA